MIDGEGGARFALVRTELGFEGACVAGAIVLTRLLAPGGYSERCGLRALVDAASLARQGGAMIYRAHERFRIERSLKSGTARPWTPRGATAQE